MNRSLATASLYRPTRFQTFLARRDRVPRILWLVAAALIARILTAGNPVVHVDEQFYLVTAQAMLDRALPYVDIWDRKPIGLFLLYLPAAYFGVPLGIWAYQAMALASVVATAALIARLADRVGWSGGALAAGTFYIFLLGLADGQGGQSPIFYNLFVVGAISLALPRAGDRSDDRARIIRSAAAMLLIGLALQIKYSVVFEGAFLGLWLVHRERRLGAPLQRLIGRAMLYASLAWAPSFAAWGSYALIGHGDAWLFANITSILNRVSDPARELVLAALTCVAFLIVPLWIAFLSWRQPAEHDENLHARRLLFGWLLASVGGLIVFGSWFNHYVLPVYAPAALCCAGYLASSDRRRNVVTPLLLVATFSASSFMIWKASVSRGGAEQVRALAASIGTGSGCLYLYSGDTILYPYSGRCRVSPWVFPSHLGRVREAGAIGVDQLVEIDRIFSTRPEMVVMGQAYKGERAESRARTTAHLINLKYELRGRWPIGHRMFDVYALNASGTVPPARLASTKP